MEGEDDDFIVCENKVEHPVECYAILTFQELYRVQQHFHVCLRIILPMKVHVSPIALAIRRTEPPQPERRWTNSLSSISYLQTIIRCYATASDLPFYVNNKDLCGGVYKSMVNQTVELETKLMGNIKTCTNFKDLIQTHTYDYIHILENCIRVLFSIEEKLLTPVVDPALIQLDEHDDAIFKQTFRVFFQQKDLLAKTRFFDFKGSIYDSYLAFLRQQLDDKKII